MFRRYLEYSIITEKRVFLMAIGHPFLVNLECCFQSQVRNSSQVNILVAFILCKIFRIISILLWNIFPAVISCSMFKKKPSLKNVQSKVMSSCN
jgi:hypothetical protein